MARLWHVATLAFINPAPLSVARRLPSITRDIDMLDDNKRFVERDRNGHPPAYAPGYKTSVARSPRQSLVSLQKPSVSELSGPDFQQLRMGQYDNDLLLNFREDSALEGTSGLPVGERIIMFGRVVDQFGKPVPNTLVEMWQANAGGR